MRSSCESLVIVRNLWDNIPLTKVQHLAGKKRSTNIQIKNDGKKGFTLNGRRKRNDYKIRIGSAKKKTGGLGMGGPKRKVGQ